MREVQFNSIDVFYISYDEPCADALWLDLLSKVPWAKRTHGVKGLDACHIACADKSETDYLITVDADNLVNPDFFDKRLTISDDKKVSAWCWRAKNVINGLIYGNGGLKLWHKDFIYNMKTHERSIDNNASIDFCWNNNYFSENGVFSEVHANWSPYQAYRAGFREGVKMGLDRGNRVPIDKMYTILSGDNLRRLITWMNIGMDANNGIWSMYGARMGFNMVINSRTPLDVISDYNWFNKHWDDLWFKYKDGNTGKCSKSDIIWNNKNLLYDFEALGTILNRLGVVGLATLDSASSKLIKDYLI